MTLVHLSTREVGRDLLRGAIASAAALASAGAVWAALLLLFDHVSELSAAYDLCVAQPVRFYPFL